MARGFVFLLAAASASASACAGGTPPATDGNSASSLGSGDTESGTGTGDEGATSQNSAGTEDGSGGGGSSQGGGSESDESGGGGVIGPCAPGVTPAFPGAAWSTMDADAAGLESLAVDAFITATGNASGALVRCGHLVATWGSADQPLEWGGVTRAVTSTMLMFAAQELRVADVDAPVAPLGWELHDEDASITLRQLANETSGYGLPEAPGAAWAYNDVAGKLFALSIYERVFDDGSPDAVVRNGARLGALHFSGGDLFQDVSGAPRFNTSPSDAARLGWFWANAGQWNGAQLLDAGVFAACVGAAVPLGLPRTRGGDVDDYLGIGTGGGGADQTGLGPGIYGCGLWLNPGGATFPGVPDDALVANGHWNGEVIAAVPSLGLVAAFVGPGADAEAFTGPLAQIMTALVDTAVE